MKKGFINEAFRLQQIAGLRPVNELFGDANPDALRLDEGTIHRYFETMVESQPETVVNILTQLMTEKLPFNQFLHDTVEDISDSYRDELGETEGMQKEQNGATKTYYTVNTYGVTEIKPYEAFGFDGTEEWEEVEFEFPSNIIKKYYTTEDGVGKVVADANASEDEVLTDLEEIDTELFY